MNSIIRVGAIGALTLGYAAAHAGIVASKSSTTPGDLLLFAEVVSGTGNNASPVAFYVGDTNVAVGGLHPASGLSNGSLIQTAGDANLGALLALAGTSGNTLEWGVQGGGYDNPFGGTAAGNAGVLTTVRDALDLTALKSRNSTDVGLMITGINGTILNTLNSMVGTGSSYEGTRTTNWDTTIPVSGAGFNAEAWYNYGAYTAQTGFGAATLYSAVAPAAGGYSVAGVGTAVLNASGLQFTSSFGPDSYNLSTHVLNIPVLGIGSATFSNVVLNVGHIISYLGGSAANGTLDSYDPTDQQLSVQAVQIGSGTYYNAVVSVQSLTSIGSVIGADSYDGHNLTISQVQAFGKIYYDVVITVAGVVGLQSGMPQNTMDVFTPTGRTLFIPAVAYAGRVFTNVTITVGNIVHIGAVSIAEKPVIDAAKPAAAVDVSKVPGAKYLYLGNSG